MMQIIDFFLVLNTYLALPSAFLLFFVAVWLTISLKFVQIRALPHFFNLIMYGVPTHAEQLKTEINPFYALFTAMSTSIGMGTIVGPSVAIMIGGPGALFWLLIYGFFGAVTKFAEVVFSIHFRSTNAKNLVGGPMQYLTQISFFWGQWYAAATVFLFAGWSAVQANVMAEILYKEGVAEWVTGLGLAFMVFVLLHGGARRIGFFNSRLVPLMFFLYTTSACIIIWAYRAFFVDTCLLIISEAFSLQAQAGGVAGAVFMNAFCSGIYKGAFITEAGVGTAAIPHALSSVKNPTDQGILAMTSVVVDIFLCAISGLLVLITDLGKKGIICNTIMYEIFQLNFPTIGKFILLIVLIMFITGTIIGNSFNGRQSFACLTQSRWLNVYGFFVCISIFAGAIAKVPLVWALMEVMLPLVAIPNVLGILYLSRRYKQVLQWNQSV